MEEKSKKEHNLITHSTEDSRQPPIPAGGKNPAEVSGYGEKENPSKWGEKDSPLL